MTKGSPHLYTSRQRKSVVKQALLTSSCYRSTSLPLVDLLPLQSERLYDFVSDCFDVASKVYELSAVTSLAQRPIDFSNIPPECSALQICEYQGYLGTCACRAGLALNTPPNPLITNPLGQLLHSALFSVLSMSGLSK